MNSSKLLLAAGIAVAAAKTEKYIIHYDEAAWNTLNLGMLPSNTEHILKELRMQIAELDASEILEFSSIPGVTLYKDAEVKAQSFAVHPSYTETFPINWGLDRIDQRALPLDNLYNYEELASDVDVWVIDSGVYADHEAFGGRATNEKNFINDDQDYDCAGHGTHVASIIAGERTGVAKGAKIRAVKVLNCDQNGTVATAVAGINYAIAQHVKSGRKSKSVMNISFDAKKAEGEALNIAVNVAIKAGIVTVVAAGNNNANACNFSPSSSPEAITVAASDRSDARAGFSNWGKCIDLYAPGKEINAAWIYSKDEYVIFLGSSAAAPHVAGVAALALSRGSASTHAEVKKYLVDMGTKDVIKDNVQDTPNVLLYSLKE